MQINSIVENKSLTVACFTRKALSHS